MIKQMKARITRDWDTELRESRARQNQTTVDDIRYEGYLVAFYLWPRKCVCFATAIISTRFEVDTTICCLVIAFLLMIRYVTLWPWPLTFWSRSAVIHGWSHGQHIHQVWKSYDYHIWVVISQRIPLTMHLQPLRMRRITWLMHCVGAIFSHVFEIPSMTRSVYSLYNFLWGYDGVFKSRLQEKIKSRRNLAPKLRFSKKGV